MIRSCVGAVFAGATLLVGPAASCEQARTDKVVSEAVVGMMSDITYTELLRQAVEKGRRYTPEEIESGYRRHLEEFKLLLIDQGYMIVIGEAGA